MMAKRSWEASSSGERWPPEVLPKHTIFLSHSGHDKPFVERLCVELKRSNYTPFFDQNSDSLPKGERFPPHLFKAAEQCLLAVIVLSKGYLTSKWPMLELAAFVRAKETKNPNMKLLPLFYGVPPSDLVPEKWMESWKKMAEDGKVHAEEIESWSKGMEVLMEAKDVETRRMKSLTDHDEEDEIMRDNFPKLLREVVRDLRPFNGLEFSNYGSSEGRYIQAVVDEICGIIPPVKKYKIDWIRGYQRICEKVSSMFEEGIVTRDFCDPRSWSLGLYGMGGVGKTTLCKAMCSFYQTEFHGRVCHVELQGDTNREQLKRLKHVMGELGGCDDTVLKKGTSVDEAFGCLEDQLKSQPAAFLAVDNVGDSESSRQEARNFIGCGLACGSKVMVTSRSRLILESVLGEAKYCKPIPRLEQQEAEELFLSVAISQKMPSPLQPSVDLIVKASVEECKFSDDGYDTQQYHPLVLRALGIFFQDVDMKHWDEASMERKKLQESRESKRVNDILGLNYANLEDGQKMLFLDVAFLFNYESIASLSRNDDFVADDYGWFISLLAALYGISTSAVKRKVEELQRKSLIFESSSSLRTHDLYIEFAQSLVKTEGSKEKAWWVGHKDANGYNTLKRLVLIHDKNTIIGHPPPQLGECRNLECLIMFNCEETLNSTLGLTLFPNLRVLFIVNSTNTAVLCAGDDVVNFDINLCGRKNPIKECLRNLRMVHLSGFDFSRIPFLRECRHVTYLSLHFWEISFDIHDDVTSFLANLEELETLFLCGPRRLGVLPDEPGFPVFVYHSILQCAASMRGLKHLGIQPGLDEEDESSSDKLDLSALGSLTTLSLAELPPSVKELVGLDQLSQLTTLNLEGCEGLSKLGNLDLLKNLRKICVCGCKGLKHPEQVEDQLKRLEELHLDYHNSMQCCLKPLSTEGS